MGLAGAAVGVSAAAGLAGAAISGSAAQSAAQTQANAATTASNNSLAQYYQTRSDLLPFQTAGQTDLSNYQNYVSNPNNLTFNPVGGSTFSPTEASLESTPGYQFDLSQGLQSTQNANAAQGLGVSGAALKGAAQYATGLANNTLMSQDQIFNSNLTNQQSVFQQNLTNNTQPSLTGAQLGENAAATTGAQGLTATGNANNYLTSGAAATAAGTVGSANALTSGLSSAAASPTNYLLLNSLLGGAGSGVPAGGIPGSSDVYLGARHVECSDRCRSDAATELVGVAAQAKPGASYGLHEACSGSD